MTKRTFIAIPIGEDMRRLIRSLYTEIPELRENVRLVPAENVHLTLKFLGDTDETQIPVVSAAIARVVADINRFQFTCDESGVFPNQRNPRVLWLGISAGAEQVCRLAQKIETALEEIGFPPENRDFRAHLTVGRLKDPRRKIAGLERFLNYKINPTIIPVENVIFYESNLTSGGAIYTRLSVVQLK
ncbi:MAG: RNA 2',3'-cyclic phosphodiesterase [Candidatus Neomarinimicrobiota bacterium]